MLLCCLWVREPCWGVVLVGFVVRSVGLVFACVWMLLLVWCELRCLVFCFYYLVLFGLLDWQVAVIFGVSYCLVFLVELLFCLFACVLLIYCFGGFACSGVLCCSWCAWVWVFL